MFVESEVQKLENWDEFINLRLFELKDEIFFNASIRKIIIRNLSVPIIDETLIEKLLSASKITNNELCVKFENCRFEEIKSTSTWVSFEFNNCLFRKNVDIGSRRGVKVTDSDFHSEVCFYPLIVLFSQLELLNVRFSERVSMKGYVFRDQAGSDHPQAQTVSRFENVIFNSQLVLVDTLFPLDLTLNSIVWPQDIQASRDVFRQLKRVMAHQHNFIQSAVFHSYEMLEYEKELKQKSWKESGGDKLLFWFNKWASNFSLSWTRPLLWVGVLSVLFYVGVWCLQPDIASFNGFFEFLNPFSWNAQEQFKKVYWLWFLHKLIVVPLVYLMVVALKRKTKL